MAREYHGRNAPINGLSLPTNRGKFSPRGTQSIGYNHSGWLLSSRDSTAFIHTRGCGVSRFYTSRCVFLFRSRLWKLPVKIEACRATLSGWYVRTRRKGGLSKRCFRGRWSAHRSAKEMAARATLIEYRCFDNSIFMYKWRVHVRSRIYREQGAPSSLRNRATRSPILALYCTLAPLSTSISFFFFSFLPSFRGILGKLRERAVRFERDELNDRVHRKASSKNL